MYQFPRKVLLALAFALPVLAGSASAAPISITGSSTALLPSADTLALTANSTNYTLGSTFVLQTGTYSVGDSGNLTGTFPFTFTENVTVAGQTLALLFSGNNIVTNPSQANTDSAIVFSGPATYFSAANVVVTPLGFTSAAIFSGQSTGVTLNAMVTAATPEPSSLLLIGTGVLSVAGVLKRRLA